MPESNISLPITGMSCANCDLNIERNIKKLQGVKETNVNFATEHADVTYDSSEIGIEELVEKIHDSGYGVTSAKVELPITGMTCANCAMNIERALKKLAISESLKSNNLLEMRCY